MKKIYNLFTAIFILLILYPFLYPEDEIIFIEGEDAVVTNFSKEATFNFKCSNLQALQLNRKSDIEGSLRFFSDYIIETTSGGEYELWIAGTPPGPADLTMPSYFSPIEVQIDDLEASSIYLEDVQVIEKYASSFYWTKIGKITFEPGSHRMRFIVKNRRTFDNYFYCYIDAFFLIKKTPDDSYIFPENLPKFFPAEIKTDKNIEFRSIEDFQNQINQNPAEIENPLMLAEIYTMTFQYTNAIKNLKIAQRINPDNIDIKRLIAQNSLWKGDFYNGLEIFKEILKKNPDNLSLFQEIAKQTAWSGLYEEAIEIYKDGIKHFPDDIDLKIDLALTYIWNNDKGNSDAIFSSIVRKGTKDHNVFYQAGIVLRKNRYNEKALELLNNAIRLQTKKYEIYLEAAEIYQLKGQTDKVDQILEQLKAVITQKQQYDEIVNAFKSRITLKYEFTKKLEEQLKKTPDDLETRLILAQAYSWNHQDDKAIEQYLRIIENRTFNKIETMETNNFDLTDYHAILNIYYNILNSYVPEFLKQKKSIDSKINNIIKTESSKNLSADAKQGLDKLITETREQLQSLNTKYNLIRLTLVLYKKRAEESQHIKENKKTLLEIFDRERQELNWNWDNKTFLSNTKSFLDKYKSYLSLKTLALVFFFLDSPLYVTYYQQLIGKYPDFEKSYYEYMMYLCATKPIAEIIDFYQDNQFTLISVDPDIQNLGEDFAELSAVNNEQQGYVFSSMTDGKSFQEYWQPFTQEFDEIIKTVNIEIVKLKQALFTLKSIMKLELYRYMLEFEKEITLLRFELGEYYLNTKQYKLARNEFQNITRVEPENIEILNKLGNIHQLTGNWFEAMKLYKMVFQNNPSNTLAASLHNSLADEHPKTFNASSYIASEGNLDNNGKYSQSMVTLTQDLNIHIYFNRYLFLDFNLDFGHKTRKTNISNVGYDGEDKIYTANYQPINWQYNFLQPNTGLTIQIPDPVIDLTFYLGLDLFSTLQSSAGNNSYSKKFIDKYENLSDISIIDISFLYPYWHLGFHWKKFSFFNIKIDYEYEADEYSIIPGIKGYYYNKDMYQTVTDSFLAQNRIMLNLSYNLGFIKFYPFTKINFRTMAQTELFMLTDPRQAFQASVLPFSYELLQEFSYKFLELKNIGLNFTILGNILYEGSHLDFDETYTTKQEISENIAVIDDEIMKDDFLTPSFVHQTLTLKGGLKIGLQFEDFTDIPLSIYLSCLPGAVFRHIARKNVHEDKDYTIPDPTVNGLLGIEYWSRNFVIYSEFNYSFVFSQTEDVHFQSFNMTLGMSVPIHQRLTY